MPAQTLNASNEGFLSRLARRVCASIDFRLVSRLSKKWERRFRAASPKNYRKDFSPHRLDQVQVFAFCGDRQVHEEILCILSFLRHVGIPKSWTVVSDGSISPKSEDLLRNLHPAIRVANWDDFLTNQNRACVSCYAAQNVWGKKLGVVTAMPDVGVGVYIDSDILFFPGADQLRDLLNHPEGNYYVPDYGFGMAPALLTEEEKKMTIINAGFLIQSKPIAWDEPLARLLKVLQTEPQTARAFPTQHYSEQTVVHLGYHASGAQALPRDRYIMELDDSYKVKDPYTKPDTVLRHFFNLSRMKLWPHAKDYLC